MAKANVTRRGGQLSRVAGGKSAVRYRPTVINDYFDERPIEIGKFKLMARSAVPVGRPTLDQWRTAFEFASNAEEASPYWVGDLLAYAENRDDYRKMLDQAKSVTGLSEQTLHNQTYIARHVAVAARLVSPSPTHSGEVASLPPAEQMKWLDLARTEGWKARELGLHIRASQRRKVIEGQAILEGMYRVIYSDNPWKYGRAAGVTAAADHYEGMTIEEQCKLPVAAHALPDSVLLMWTTAPVILQNPGPREVGEAWGFTYKQQIIWDKVDHNYSHYTGANHEILTIWTRGSCVPDLPTDLPDSVQVIRKSRTHSDKPEEFRRLIEKHWTRGPYLELFGRDRHEGWTVFGNDSRLWSNEAEEQDHGGTGTAAQNANAVL